MSRAGAFALHVRCDVPRDASKCQAEGVTPGRDTFTGANLEEALRAAERAGWILPRSPAIKVDTCPRCAARAAP